MARQRIVESAWGARGLESGPHDRYAVARAVGEPTRCPAFHGRVEVGRSEGCERRARGCQRFTDPRSVAGSARVDGGSRGGRRRSRDDGRVVRIRRTPAVVGSLPVPSSTRSRGDRGSTGCRRRNRRHSHGPIGGARFVRMAPVLPATWRRASRPRRGTSGTPAPGGRTIARFPPVLSCGSGARRRRSLIGPSTTATDWGARGNSRWRRRT